MVISLVKTGNAIRWIWYRNCILIACAHTTFHTLFVYYYLVFILGNIDEYTVYIHSTGSVNKLWNDNRLNFLRSDVPMVGCHYFIILFQYYTSAFVAPSLNVVLTESNVITCPKNIGPLLDSIYQGKYVVFSLINSWTKKEKYDWNPLYSHSRCVISRVRW